MAFSGTNVPGNGASLLAPSRSETDKKLQNAYLIQRLAPMPMFASKPASAPLQMHQDILSRLRNNVDDTETFARNIDVAREDPKPGPDWIYKNSVKELTKGQNLKRHIGNYPQIWKNSLFWKRSDNSPLEEYKLLRYLLV